MDSTQALIFLDSDDRIKNSSAINNGDVAFPVNFKANTVKRMALASYDFMVNFDNINESNNRVVIEDTLLVSYVVTVPPGKYTHSALATAIDVALTATGLGAFTVTYNADGRYSITAPVQIFFQENPFNPGGKDWADMIGIRKGSPFATVFDGGVADIAYTDKLYIVCDDVHRFKLVSDEASNQKLQNVLGVVYVNENSKLDDTLLDPKHATNRLPWLKWVKHKLLTELGPLSVSIRDDRGNRIADSQLANLRWSIEMYVEEGFVR
jgi:hypothetical protein